jgi:hypothetical protein
MADSHPDPLTSLEGIGLTLHLVLYLSVYYLLHSCKILRAVIRRPRQPQVKLRAAESMLLRVAQAAQASPSQQTAQASPSRAAG